MNSPFHAGAGIHVVNSNYHKNTAVPNNALIVRQSSCSYSCYKVHFYCYSNSSSSSVGYIIFPNGGQVYNTYDYGDMSVFRTSPAGMYAHNYHRYTPDYWGIYTCQIPDSLGRNIERNIGIYAKYVPKHLWIPTRRFSCSLHIHTLLQVHHPYIAVLTRTFPVTHTQVGRLAVSHAVPATLHPQLSSGKGME